MLDRDISLFDTRSNTIVKAGLNTNSVKITCKNNQSIMISDGKVVALIEENFELKAVSFTLGELTARVIKDFGN